MAFIHASSGHVIRVTASREAIAMSIERGLRTHELLEFETEGQKRVKVTLNPHQITLVTEEPLPSAAGS
jgi:hypothetical protein